MPSENSITQLLPSLMDGDSQAVRVVWDQFFAKLCHVAHQRLSSRHARMADGEDVAASAFASVCRRLQKGDFQQVASRDDLWRLLAQVAERKACTLLRHETRQKRGGGKVSGESVFLSLDSSGALGIQAIASAEPSPQFVVEMSETIGNMFNVLDEPSRRVAMLRLEGYENKEIAKQLGCSLATVERKLKLIRAHWSSLPDESSS